MAFKFLAPILGGALGGLFGRNRQSATTTNAVNIPSFLQPFLNQGARTAGGSLSSLSSLLGGDLVAGFSPFQQQAFDMAGDVASGGGGFLPTAQQTLLGAARGGGLSGFLPPEALAALNLGAQGGAVPTAAMDALGGLLDGSFMPSVSSDALTSTARGDFLHGGPGFDAAVNAAVRAAQPHILSTFGRAGAGGATGGLAQTAIAQAASDAFANQFGMERGRQLGAASELANFGLAGQSQRMGAAGLLGNLGLAGRGQQMQAGGQLGDLANAERQRQLMAAGMLPGIGMAGADIFSRLGAQQQAQSQRELSAPIDAQMMLLQSALGGLPIAALLGQTTTQQMPQNMFGNILGGALTAGSLFGGRGGG